MSENETSPEPKSRAISTPPSVVKDDSVGRRQKSFRHAWRRRPSLLCGCTEYCRCRFKANPTDQRVDGYLAAVRHLALHKLPAAALTPECRELWRRGGDERELAETIVRRWTA